jgi:hypothetical protein
MVANWAATAGQGWRRGDRRRGRFGDWPSPRAGVGISPHVDELFGCLDEGAGSSNLYHHCTETAGERLASAYLALRAYALATQHPSLYTALHDSSQHADLTLSYLHLSTTAIYPASPIHCRPIAFAPIAAPTVHLTRTRSHPSGSPQHRHVEQIYRQERQRLVRLERPR